MDTIGVPPKYVRNLVMLLRGGA